jgi:signal transduction histidine kinase
LEKNLKNAEQTRPLISLRTIFGVLFFLLMIGTILLSFLVNTLFLERYYLEDRKRALIGVYDELQEASVLQLLTTDDFDVSLRESLRQGNMSLLVMDSNTSTVKVWSADEMLMEERLYANIFGMTPVLTSDQSGSLDKYDNDVQTDREDIYGEGLEEENEDDEAIDDPLYYAEFVITQILEEEQPYTINVVLDRRARSRSIEMWGPLGESSFFLLRTPLEDIRSSAAAANRFFGYVGVVLAVIGTFLAVWLSRRITEPLRQLTDISVRMKELDFSAKYDGKNHTELDILGRNMNELSQKLEETISALRTANNDLQRDLDRRNRQEEMRQEFLSNVTHELKTPIALIRGYAEGLQDGIADDPESRSFYLDTIVDESDKMNVIVQKVLQLNQLEFGDNSVAMERFDIVDMIRNYLDSASILARQEDVKLQFDRRSPLYVWGDPFMIQEVFQNYYSNALHHVEPRSQSGSAPEKVIDIRCDETGGKARITVFNTGKPIPEESLPHIWEKFYKVDKARTRAYGGSGVGLSIVKAIMQLHHQAYGAENYDNGVAFWFELDTQATQAPQAGLDTQAAQTSPNADVSGAGEKA